jgi:hypothetical protein
MVIVYDMTNGIPIRAISAIRASVDADELAL